MSESVERIGKYRVHPAATLFPLLEEDAFAQLVADIRRNGLRQPIVVDSDGSILDGRNRLRACRKAGVEPRFTKWRGESPLLFVVSLNLARRHLTPSACAVLAYRMEQRFPEEIQRLRDQAAARQRAPLKRGDALPVKETIPERDKGQFRDALARLVNCNPRYVDDAYRVAERAPQLLGPILAGAVTIPQAMRTLKEGQRESRRSANQDLVDASSSLDGLEGVFSTIVIDPPWDWGDEGDQDQLGRARPTYATMSIEKLEAMPVGGWAAEDCHLYLWITNRSLPKGFGLIEAWGFRYVTCLTWCKPSFGMGNYFRGSTEQVLFAVKGSLALRRKNVGTWFAARRPRGHSVKPPEFYKLVESCSPGPYLDCFARRPRDGWTTRGAEV